MGIQVPPPLALYIHIPWCVRKCPYCDFNSHALRGDIPEAAYLQALRRDLESALPSVWGRPITSIFIGGGTPSLLSAGALDALLTQVRTLLPVRPGAEVTLEANPGTFEAARFKAYRAAGINRLSIGVQSFDSAKLIALGRIHDGREARAAVEVARGLFDNLNLDLMYALPGQDMLELRADLDAAIGFAPEHLSVYHLTLEPNTAFASAPPPLPDDDLAADMHEWLEMRLAEAGYDHYETSAYARPERYCRHNLNYWQYGDYLGIGAGAHSKLTSAGGVQRQARVKHPNDYLAHSGTPLALAEERQVGRADLAFEFMMNALRLNSGFDPALFTERTGLPITQIEARLVRAVELGLLERDLHAIRPTGRGQRFLNELLGLFLD
ncbi:MAG: oxygen-independent coproporphyrinogen III oxidase-like protein [Hydrogenophilales bacterium]|nr:oxygen-independent coproporphyrinogen III oxidase-like protein [Hydrogenophilales bacterium]